MANPKISFNNNSEVGNPTIKPKVIKDTVGSITSFFSIAYAILLTISMAYNIGYFKYINPQLVELMSIGDYVSDTIHNVWFFLLAGILFFCSSLAVIKKRVGEEFYNITIFGFLTLIASSYFLLKGIHYSKVWPTLKTLFSIPSFLSLFIITSIFVLFLISFLVYKLSSQVIREGIPIYSVGIMPVIIFFVLVLAPYIGGMAQGYIESQYLMNKDYKIQAVEIVTGEKNERNKKSFIIKTIDKGIIVRQFNPTDPESHGVFRFINWNDIKYINYKDVNAIR